MRSMCGDIGRGAAVFASQGEPLQEAKRDEAAGGEDSPCAIARQKGQQEGGEPDDENGGQESVLAADHIPQAAEYDGAERSHGEAGGERQQGENVSRRGFERREKLGPDNGRQDPEKVEVVPLENRSQGRRENDFSLF